MNSKPSDGLKGICIFILKLLRYLIIEMRCISSFSK